MKKLKKFLRFDTDPKSRERRLQHELLLKQIDESNRRSARDLAIEADLDRLLELEKEMRRKLHQREEDNNKWT
jgi:hypothetical protein